MDCNLILADPPWQYSNSGITGAASKHYKTMSDEELYAFPIDDYASPDAVLVMWATWPKLSTAMNLIWAWGFEYKSGMPWIKVKNEPHDETAWGQGWWVRGVSEPILIARRGEGRYPPQQFVGLISHRFKHSKKPNSVYEYCEAFPGPYCELFARERRAGWESHGDEL